MIRGKSRGGERKRQTRRGTENQGKADLLPLYYICRVDGSGLSFPGARCLASPPPISHHCPSFIHICTSLRAFCSQLRPLTFPILLIFLVQMFHLAARLQSLHHPCAIKCCEKNRKLQDDLTKPPEPSIQISTCCFFRTQSMRLQPSVFYNH